MKRRFQQVKKEIQEEIRKELGQIMDLNDGDHHTQRIIKVPKPIRQTKNRDTSKALMIVGEEAKKRAKRPNRMNRQNLAHISPILVKQWVSVPRKSQRAQGIDPRKKRR